MKEHNCKIYLSSQWKKKKSECDIWKWKSCACPHQHRKKKKKQQKIFCWGELQVVLIVVFGINNTPDLWRLIYSSIKKARLIIIVLKWKTWIKKIKIKCYDLLLMTKCLPGFISTLISSLTCLVFNLSIKLTFSRTVKWVLDTTLAKPSILIRSLLVLFYVFIIATQMSTLNFNI